MILNACGFQTSNQVISLRVSPEIILGSIINLLGGRKSKLIGFLRLISGAL